MAGEASRTDPARKTDQRHNGAFVVGSILGGLTGAAVALWKAPRTGKELREKLMGEEDGSRRVVVSGVGAGSRGVLSGVSAGSQRVVSGVAAASQRVSVPDPAAVKASVSSSGASFSNRVMSLVERATAPIVGVKLGKTANGSGPDAGGNAGNGSSVRSTASVVSSVDTSSGDQVDQGTATRSSSRTTLHAHGDEGVPDRMTFGTYSGRSSGSQSAAPASEPATESVADATIAQSGSSASTVEDATPSPASPEIPSGVPGHVPSTEELVTPRTPFVPESDTAPQSSQQFPDRNDGNRS